MRLWLPCKEAALKSVLWRTPAKEKQTQPGICQLQHFSSETKASVACWKDGQNVRVQTLTIDPAGGEKQLPSLCTNCLPYLAVFDCVGEKRRSRVHRLPGIYLASPQSQEDMGFLHNANLGIAAHSWRKAEKNK